MVSHRSVVVDSLISQTGKDLAKFDFQIFQIAVQESKKGLSVFFCQQSWNPTVTSWLNICENGVREGEGKKKKHGTCQFPLTTCCGTSSPSSSSSFPPSLSSSTPSPSKLLFLSDSRLALRLLWLCGVWPTIVSGKPKKKKRQAAFFFWKPTQRNKKTPRTPKKEKKKETKDASFTKWWG